MESLKIDEIDEISKERDFQLRSLAQHIQGTSNEALFERFLRHLSGQDETLRKIREQFKKISLDKSLQDQLRISELDEFKSLVALARQLGPVLAEELGEILLNEFGDDPLGYSIGIGAPDLLLWTESDENEFWFFSEVKAHRDYLSSTQKVGLRGTGELFRDIFS